MEAGRVKGTVTPLSSLFPAQDARKAASRVQAAISENQRKLEQLQGFITDNDNMIKLVQKLPEELHHEVMVLLLFPLCWAFVVMEKENYV